MKRGNHLLSILALSVLPVTAGLATQPIPTQGKAGAEARHAQKGSKTGVDAQKKTQSSRGTPDHMRRMNAAPSKEGVEARQGKVPDAAPSGAKTTSAKAGMITKSVRPHGTSPVVGAVATRNAASISGTGVHLRGTAPAVIHPAVNHGARISGTGIAGKN